MIKLNSFESEFSSLQEKKSEADEIMKIPGNWKMIDKKAGHLYQESLNKTIAFIEGLYNLFEDIRQSGETESLEKDYEELKEEKVEQPKEIIEEQGTEPKKEERKFKKFPLQGTWEELDENKKKEILDELISYAKHTPDMDKSKFSGKRLFLRRKYGILVPITLDEFKKDIFKMDEKIVGE